MIKIRPFDFSDEDYYIAIEISMACYPEYVQDIESWKHGDRMRDADRLYQRFIIEADGKPVGVGSYSKSSAFQQEGLYSVGCSIADLSVIDAALPTFFNFALEKLSQRQETPRVIMTNTREDKGHKLAYLENNGYKMTQRYPVSRLKMADFHPEKHLQAFEKLKENRIELLSLDQFLARDPEAKHKIWDLIEHELMIDVPLPYEYSPEPYEKWIKRLFEHPHFDPTLQWFALEGDKPVGYSALYIPPQQPELAFTGLTGVTRAGRRKGIATALKVSAISRAFEREVEEIETDNEENNPMYQLNLQLGFKPWPAWMDFEKHVE